MGYENYAYASAKEYCAYIYIFDQKHTYNTSPLIFLSWAIFPWAKVVKVTEDYNQENILYHEQYNFY